MRIHYFTLNSYCIPSLHSCLHFTVNEILWNLMKNFTRRLSAVEEGVQTVLIFIVFFFCCSILSLRWMRGCHEVLLLLPKPLVIPLLMLLQSWLSASLFQYCETQSRTPQQLALNLAWTMLLSRFLAGIWVNSPKLTQRYQSLYTVKAVSWHLQPVSAGNCLGIPMHKFSRESTEDLRSTYS